MAPRLEGWFIVRCCWIDPVTGYWAKNVDEKVEVADPTAAARQWIVPCVDDRKNALLMQPTEDDLPLPQRAIGLPNLLAAQDVWPALVLQVIDEDIRTYDLGQVLEDFLAVLDQDPSVTRWAAGEVLASNLLDISTTHAIGGAIAYQYATTGTVDGLTPEQIRSVLASVDFVLVPQRIDMFNTNAGPILGNAIADQSLLYDTLLQPFYSPLLARAPPRLFV